MKSFFPLMQPISTNQPPNSSAWIHQVKYDGIRLLTVVDSTGVRLYTRNQKLRNQQYPELTQIVDHVQAKSFMLDGEVIVRSTSGKPSFAAVMKRDRSDQLKKISQLVKTHPIEYHVFDLLMNNDEDLRSLPLYQRIERLYHFVQSNQWLRIVENYTDGEQLYEDMLAKNWEGIVSKDLHSRYMKGKHHRAWYKTKIKQQQLCVIAGVQYKQGFPNALLLGVYIRDTLHFVGKVASGLSSEDIQLLHSYVPQLEQQNSPFYEEIVQSYPIRWIRPQLTVLVEYTELTDEGLLRHPNMIGFTIQAPQQARWDT